MRTELTLAAGMVAIMALAGATRAHAADDFVIYTDEAQFEARGVIDQVINFDAQPDDQNTFFAGPVGAGPITFLDDVIVTGKNISPYFSVENAITPAFGAFYEANIDQPYDLFSFRIARAIGVDFISLGLSTQDDFFLMGLGTFKASEEFFFVGIEAPEGQHFTHFYFVGNDGETVPAISEFQLGTVGCGQRVCDPGGAVPEPTAWAMMILGFGLTGAVVRRRRPVLRTA
jgi:hypothetical protein